MKDTKAWTKLLSIPSNRSCADCQAALVDTLQIYASFSYPAAPPLFDDDDGGDNNNGDENRNGNNGCKSKANRKRIQQRQPGEETTTTSRHQTRILTLENSFQRNHFVLHPDRRPHDDNDVDVDDDDDDDDFDRHLIDYGVLVCAPCAAAHAALITSTTSMVKPIHTVWDDDDDPHDRDQYTAPNCGSGASVASLEQWFLQIASNAQANLVLEGFFMSPQQQRRRRRKRTRYHRRPTTHSSVADRLMFCRSKYHAYDYLLPPMGPLAISAWQRLVYLLHPEWTTEKSWGMTLLEGLVPLPSSLGNNYNNVDEDDEGPPSLLWNHDRAEKAEQWPHLLLCQPPQQPPNGLLQQQKLPKQLVDYFCVVAPTVESMRQQAAIISSSDRSSRMNGGTTDEHRPFDNAGTTAAATTAATTSSYDEATTGSIPLTPTVTDCYPDMDVATFPNAIATFCFPDQCVMSRTVSPPTFFTQVLTNGAGQRIYAAILTVHEPRANFEDVDAESTSNDNQDEQSPQLGGVWYIPKCLVLLSHYAFFDLFRNVLLQLHRIATTCAAPLPIERFVANFCQEVPLPPSGRIKIHFGFTTSSMWEIARPPPNRLPLANISFEPLFACLSIPNVLTVVACLLRETRVALLSSHAALLCPVAEALLHLLFPLHWSGLYIPVLPYHMADIMEAPVPYLIGIHARYARQPVTKRCPTTVLVMLDDDTVHLGCDDAVLDALDSRSLPPMPERLTNKLRTRLIKAVGQRTYCRPGKGTITTGDELQQVVVVDRECYAHPLVPTATDESLYLRQRKDVMGNVDKAYMDNEWLVPIQGFLSETGQFHSKRPTKVRKQVTKKKFHFRSASPLMDNNSSSSASPTSIENAPVAGSRSILDLQGGPEDFSTDEVRDAFLKFFVSVLQDYRLYLATNGFREKEFIDNEAPADRAFMTGLVQTQMFECFVEERRECPDDPEVRFFDESIAAKFNRSKMVLARGGKKETTFLDDKRFEFVETFTPPPPSNWGLPDDGAMYHYSTFPKLRKELFGKVRTPQPWVKGDAEEMSSARFSTLTRRRSAYGFADTNFVASQQRPSFFFRPKKSFNVAIRTLSAPFSGRKMGITAVNSTPEGNGSDRSTSSDLSLSKHQDGSSCDDRIAENARRRHMILIGILVKFQSHCRIYLARRQLRRKHGLDLLRARSRSGIISNDLAATVIQARYRTKFHRGRLTRLRNAVTKISTFRRGNRVRFLFRMIRQAVVRVQAGQRGRVARIGIHSVVAARMALYRRQIFELWHLLMTPLCYRAAFWSCLDKNELCMGFVRLALAEEELKRLWSGLRDSIGDETCPAPNGVAACMHNSTYIKAVAVQRFLKNESASASLLKPMNGAAFSLSTSLIAERTQVYDKLAKLDEQDVDALFKEFSISHGEKKKKETLAQTIWCSYNDADGSANLVLKLFPSIRTSSRVEFNIPSKKALRRFGSATGIPDCIMIVGDNVYRRLDDRIRTDILEIVRATLSLSTSSKGHRPPTDAAIMRSLFQTYS